MRYFVFAVRFLARFKWYFYGQRRRDEFKKAVEGAVKFFPGIKIKPEQELCFQSS